MCRDNHVALMIRLKRNDCKPVALAQTASAPRAGLVLMDGEVMERADQKALLTITSGLSVTGVSPRIYHTTQTASKILGDYPCLNDPACLIASILLLPVQPIGTR